jgi:DNA-binding NarL/FixJ family response regulator
MIMDRSLKVIIADDHPYEVSGIIGLLDFTDEVEVVGSANSAQQAVRMVIDLQPDVVMLDMVWYKNKDEGVTAIQQIREGAPETRILVMTAYDEMLESAKIVGADLVIHKDFLGSKRALVDRIKDAYGSRLLPQSTNRYIESLTPREYEVLKLIAQGETDAGIALQLDIAETTVKKHVSNIIGKLGSKNRAQAAAVAYELGILPKGTVDV